MIVCPFLRDECTQQCALFDTTTGCKIALLADATADSLIPVVENMDASILDMRLTKPMNGVVCCNTKCPPGQDGVSDKCDSCTHHARMIDKLGELEDVMEQYGLSVEDIRAFALARREGRCEIQPCPPGTWVFKIERTQEHYAAPVETTVKPVRFKQSMKDEIGESIFLTQGEAEKAMEVMAHAK